MIRVDRARHVDGAPVRPSDAWFERAEQMRARAISEGADHEITNLYKDVEVKTALEKIFHDKCAYCESRPSADSPWDVEHYRPKGRVAEREGHPGYYWLAYTWENLYPSCLFCNQRRKDAPRWGDPTSRPAQGKLDQFPVEAEGSRAMSPDDDPTLERPLLIDPCASDDDPEEHLTYDVQGQIMALDPDDVRATETIRICHLERRRLRDDRARIIVRVAKILGNLGRARRGRNATAETLIQEILDDFLSAEALYAGAARAVVRDPDAYLPPP